MNDTEDRWTVDDDGWLRVPSGRRKAQIEGDHADLFRSALDAEYARRALPDGVELHRDGTLWALGRDIPDGWDRRVTDGGKWWPWESNGCAIVGPSYPNSMHEVRPPQTPPTVRVQWWEAFNDCLPMAAWKGQQIKNAQRQAGGVFLSTWGLFPVIRIDVGGTVEVLA